MEDLFHSSGIDGIGISKFAQKNQNEQAGKGRNSDLIHSFSTKENYLRSWHNLVDFAKSEHNLRDVERMNPEIVREYLEQRANTVSKSQLGIDRSAIGKLESALNKFSDKFEKGNTYDFKNADRSVAVSNAKGSQAVWQSYGGRGYERPQELVNNIKDPVHHLQAQIQLEAGCRAEGVGAPHDGKSNAEIRTVDLKGFIHDPVTGKEVGAITTIEKGGKEATHCLSQETYHRLEAHIVQNGSLKSNYQSYLQSINQAAKATEQYVSGRGSHGLRWNFATNRYNQALENARTHEQAQQIVSWEMSHERLSITEHYQGR